MAAVVVLMKTLDKYTCIMGWYCYVMAVYIIDDCCIADYISVTIQLTVK